MSTSYLNFINKLRKCFIHIWSTEVLIIILQNCNKQMKALNFSIRYVFKITTVIS